MSKIEVDTIDSRSGSATLTLGSTNATTLALNSGITTLPSAMTNTPAFFAYLSSNQANSSNDTYDKILFDTEILDSDSCYDNATNYRFTPTSSGYYKLFGSVAIDCSSSNFEWGFVAIYKNGSLLYEVTNQQTTNNANHINVSIDIIEQANGSTDYFELFAKGGDSSGVATFNAGAGNRRTTFGGFKLIGT
jgi:hypothetical protein